jgi:hypothetical protein
VLSYVVCFNFYDISFPVTRACLSIVLVFALFTNVWKQIQETRNSSNNSNPISMRLLIIPSSIAFILVTLGLNILLLVQLRWNNSQDINTTNIKMGFFDPNEQLEINSGMYKMDQYFDTRLVGSLNDIVKSNNKTLVKRICVNRRCSYIYRRQYSFNINCNERTQEFYKDCEIASSLSVKLQYTDRDTIPVYSCAMKYGSVCLKSQCPELDKSKYRLMLIQLNNNDKRVEPAWKGLCKCGNKQPNVLLNYSENLDACYCCSNSLKLTFSWTILLLILFSTIN